jgi:hypothetical protein
MSSRPQLLCPLFLILWLPTLSKESNKTTDWERSNLLFITTKDGYGFNFHGFASHWTITIQLHLNLRKILKDKILITLNRSTNLQSNACLWRLRQGKKKGKCFLKRIQIWYRMSSLWRSQNLICFLLLSILPVEVEIQLTKKLRQLNNLTFLFKLYRSSYKWDKNLSPSFQKTRLIEKCLVKLNRTVNKRWSSSH